MNTLIVAAIISVATADIPTTTTINDRNNSESTDIKNYTGSTIKVSLLTTENSESVNTTESTNVLLSRKNGTITRQGKITEVLNITSKAIQYRNHPTSNEDKKDTNREENNQLQIEFITKAPETQRNILKNIFEKILSYKNIHLEKDYDKDEKDKIIKAYILLVSQKYKRKWIPKNLGLKLFSVKNMTLKVRPTIKRPKRSIKEDAGFTHDAETCKQYNNNLLLMWSNLSKYISTSEKSPPNKSVLHNIGIMIKAYLDHVTPIKINTEAATEKLIVRKERNISTILSPIINEIKTKMDRKEINEVNTLTAFILDQVKHYRIDNINEECNKIMQNQIAKLINIAFKKYLVYANCNNLYNNEHNNGNINVLNNIPLNQGSYNLQPLKVPKFDESRFDQNLLKIVKRSVETTNNIVNTSTLVTDLSSEKDVNNSNSNNLIMNETIYISNEHKNSIQGKGVETRRVLQLNGKFCADLALDQFILTVKLILKLYLLNNDCTSGAYKFTIISKLIEATPILEPFDGNTLNYLSQYQVLLRLLDIMETKEMSNLFTPKAEVLKNKNTLEEFLHDINNLALSMNYKQKENNKISDNDLKYQLLLNSLYNYQQLHNNDRLLKSKNAILGSINAEDNPILPIGNNKITQNVKEFQGTYTGVPINQHFEANRSIIYEYLTNKTYDTKPITIGSTINSGSINYSRNYLGKSDGESAILPILFSASDRDYSNINPMKYNLMMNYSKTYPTNTKQNYASLGSGGAYPYLNLINNTSLNMKPFKNELLHKNLASNPDALSDFFSKFAKINHNPENQLKNSPSVPNNGVLLNLLNNRAMLNNNFNTKSEVSVKEANVNTYLPNPALERQNLNIPSNFGVNSGVSYYNQINNALTNNMNSNLIKNDNFDLLRDNNLVRDKNAFNPFDFNNFNDFNLMKSNILRSNPNFNDIKNSLQPNGNLFLRNSYPLRTLNVPQMQKTPVIYRTDLNPNSLNGFFVNNQSLNVINSSYIKTQPIQTSKTSGVTLKNIQSIEKTKQNPSKSLFINPYANLIKKENDAPDLQSNFLRTYDKKLETNTSPITSIDNLPTISSDPDANGDVELTYVFHHPQIVVYQPQVLVKRRISYIDYINNFNKIFNNQKKSQQQLHLYKIIRYLPHNNVQVLYQSDSLFPILKIENTTSSN